jgi:hypothetical protein
MIIKKNSSLAEEIIDDIIIQGEAIYFKHPERLLIFLMLRALMHNLVYLNPEFQHSEYGIGLCIAFLVKQNHLTKKELLLGCKEYPSK